VPSLLPGWTRAHVLAHLARNADAMRNMLAGARSGSLAPADIGLLLGSLRQPGGNGPDLYSSWEDTVLAFMGPRSGKTTSLAIPYVLSAPGPVIATSNKADLWAATAELRAAAGSRVWVFDPQRITAAGQRWWWNPLAGLATVEAAHRLAGHFVLTVDDSSRRDIWGPAAQELLTSLLLAAAASRRTLRDVSRWLDDPGSPTPAELLDVLRGASARGAFVFPMHEPDGYPPANDMVLAASAVPALLASTATGKSPRRSMCETAAERSATSKTPSTTSPDLRRAR